MMTMLAQEHVGGGMKCAADDPSAALVGQLGRPIEHFLGRAPGKGEQYDGFRGNALFNEVGHPVDQGPGFSAAGPGNDQDGAVAVGNSGILGLVEGLPGDRRFWLPGVCR